MNNIPMGFTRHCALCFLDTVVMWVEEVNIWYSQQQL